jgi:hypothetical protein
MGKLIQIGGKRYGRWRVGAYAGRSKWFCTCDCDTQRAVRSACLRSGRSRSCGCLQREVIRACNTTHGMSKTSAYCRWENMKQRTGNPRSDRFEWYGARGISIEYGDWITSFEAYYADTGDPPAGLSLDRIDNARGYAPDNVQWATTEQQLRNRRPYRKRRRSSASKP